MNDEQNTWKERYERAAAAYQESESRGRQYCLELAEKAGEIRRLKDVARAAYLFVETLGDLADSLPAEDDPITGKQEMLRTIAALEEDKAHMAPQLAALSQTATRHKAQVERLREGLRRLEWSEVHQGEFYCPACGMRRFERGARHTDDCFIAALLSEDGAALTAGEEAAPIVTPAAGPAATLFGFDLDTLAEAVTESTEEPEKRRGR